jgi:3-hydroxyacyl-[acyl-carrier-protein] dehydratase
VSSDASASPDRIRQLLRGFPEAAIEACQHFEQTRSVAVFEDAMSRIIQHHLETPTATDVSALPGSTRLVEDLGLDSLTMVEMVFLFEDLFATKIPPEELTKVVTLEDLRTLLKARLPAAPAA